MFEVCCHRLFAHSRHSVAMNARELSRYEVTQLRCGLPGPWQDLLPLMLAAVSENYVLVGEATRPSPPFTGLGSLFTPSPGAGADTGLRQRRASTQIGRASCRERVRTRHGAG